MRPDIAGPMPLIDSSSAWLAWLRSTAANAEKAKAASMEVMRVRIMVSS